MKILGHTFPIVYLFILQCTVIITIWIILVTIHLFINVMLLILLIFL